MASMTLDGNDSVQLLESVVYLVATGKFTRDDDQTLRFKVSDLEESVAALRIFVEPNKNDLVIKAVV
jgi:hypothetical protein